MGKEEMGGDMGFVHGFMFLECLLGMQNLIVVLLGMMIQPKR
jgi:hypothetical protein